MSPHRAPESHKNRSRHLRATDPTAEHDLVCIGFGPASLAIAVALHDALEAGSLREGPKVLFLEKQGHFAWHAGMLLPGARMQISFIKDLATLRDPTSNFTFLNYLHHQGRLVEFTNLGTFLPARVEYEDYLRWCAGFFDEVVKYGTEALSVSPEVTQGSSVRSFIVSSRNIETGDLKTFRARNVLLAIGGQPSIPRYLPTGHPRVVHSSQYANLVPQILKDPTTPHRVAILGAGQSAAEIFNNIQALYPNSRTWLVMRSPFLRQSDDSPFINSIFNPGFVDSLYPRSSACRRNLVTEARSTNYGVVRVELIEQLYERMYEQRRVFGSDEARWPHRIMGGRRVVGVDLDGNGFRIHVAPAREDGTSDDSPSGAITDGDGGEVETLDVDLIIAATGYVRNAHVDMLRDVWPLLPRKAVDANAQNGNRAGRGNEDSWDVHFWDDGSSKTAAAVLEVRRDYGVRFSRETVADGSGIWLQGCCEGTHGLSDTLLSVLATRSGEIVDTIFGIHEDRPVKFGGQVRGETVL